MDLRAYCRPMPYFSTHPNGAHEPFPPTVSELASRFSIPIWRYVLYCFLASLILRSISCLFKARGIQGGEHLKDGGKNEYEEYWKAYKIAFKGFGGGRIEDLW